MYCIFCGKQLPDGARFCPQCGKAVTSDAAYEEDKSSMHHESKEIDVASPQCGKAVTSDAAFEEDKSSLHHESREVEVASPQCGKAVTSDAVRVEAKPIKHERPWWVKVVAKAVAVVFLIICLLVLLLVGRHKGTTSTDTTITVNGESFEMVWVEGGTFQMGSNDGWRDEDGDSDEEPVHSVTLDGYYIGRTEVTQALWEAVMGSNPSRFEGSNNPVECVSWDDCQQFVEKLSSLTGRRFSLPTEAQWEYAARGGSKSRGYKYSGSNDIGSVAWYDDNSGNRTHPVAQKQPNELGLYDMSGNVWEWCQDWYSSSYYANTPTRNPLNNVKASFRVYRGGGYWLNASYCRSAIRFSSNPGSRGNFLGLRLVLLP